MADLSDAPTDSLYPNWFAGASILSDDDSEGSRSALGGAYPPIEPLLQSLYSSMATHFSTQSRSQSQSLSPVKDLQDAIQMVYRHLHEKHYLDRIVNALYLDPVGRFGGRRSDGEHVQQDLLTFASKSRVVFPRPSKLQDVIERTRDCIQDLTLLTLVLTEPLLRFRLCAIAHLLETVFAPVEGAWVGEHPRLLSTDEMSFVMKKLRDFFTDLFQQPEAQVSLRRFLTNLHEWCAQDLTDQDEDIAVPSFPAIVNEIFPCYDTISQEFRNILTSAMEDGNIHAQAWTVFKFVMLSLKQPKFVSASDWIAVGSLAFDNLQKTLSGQVYRGPAQRLIRNIVSTMNQLWEGGCITDTSLAIEKCLANVIHKSFDGGIPMDQEIENGASLHMVQEFEQLIRGVANNIMPIPLPSIIWIHENSEICLDSMVLQFPGSLSGNVKLDYIELDKGTPRWRRQWHLKIDGLEIETKNVPYYFVAKTPLRLVDIGELSISMPSKSLEIEIKFIVTPPRIHYETKSSDPTTSVTTTATDASAPGWGEVDPSVTTTTTDSQVPQATGTPGTPTTDTQSEQSTSAFDAISRFFRPKRDYNRLTKVQTTPLSSLLQAEQRRGWIPTTDRIVWGCPRRRVRYGSESSGSRGNSRQTTGDRLGDTAGFTLITQQHRTFIEVEGFSVRIRKLDVHVHATKHPIFHTFTHTLLVSRLRQAIEKMFEQMVMDIVDTINSSAEDIMEFSHEELQSQHAEGSQRMRW